MGENTPYVPRLAELKMPDSDHDIPPVSDIEAYDRFFDRPKCPRCDGCGQVYGLTTPIVVSVIGAAMTWLGWTNAETLVSVDSTHYHIEMMLLLMFGGPALVVAAWWKWRWQECEECNGCGRVDGTVPPDPSLAQPIAEDQACHRCGYNTRTKRVGDACPECGTSILTWKAVEEHVEARRARRVGLAVGLSFIVGLVGMSLMFGNYGSLGFMGAWILVTLVLTAVAYLRRK